MAHHQLATSLSETDNSDVKLLAEKVLTQIRSELKCRDDINHICFSSEAFNNLCGISVANKLVEFFSTICGSYNFQSYIFIRELADFSESMYLQSNRFGHVTVEFMTYLESRKKWAKKYIEGLIFLQNKLPSNFNIRYRTEGFDILGVFENMLSLPEGFLINISKTVPPTNKRSLKEEVILSALSKIELKVGFPISRRKLLRLFEAGSCFEYDIYTYTLYEKYQRRAVNSFFLNLAKELGLNEYLQVFGDAKIKDIPCYSINSNILRSNDIDYIHSMRKDIEA